jgi:hypothetical protein
MPGPITQIIADIDAFQPMDGNWLGLDALLSDLFQSDSPESGMDAMFRIFERYPEEDGCGVFWSIVHGLESLPAYESKLVEAVRRVPTEFSLIMVYRLLNADCNEVDGISLLELLEQIAKDEAIHPQLRKEIQEYLESGKLTP